MPGVPKELIEHSLNVNPTATPKKQRLRRFSVEKREAIKKELAKLLTLDSSVTVQVLGVTNKNFCVDLKI